MNRLTEFFREGTGGALGVFYPTNHIVALFPSAVVAQQVKQELDNVAPSTIAVTGKEMLEFLKDKVEEDGLWGSLMREVSRIAGTEEQYVDQDAKDAAKGAAFVVAYSPDEAVKQSAWVILQKANPLAARFYGTGGIEHLVGGTT